MGYIIITKPGCSYCTRAKALLKSNNHSFAEDVRDTPEAIQRFKDAGYATFPQIFHDGLPIGGYTELADYLD